MGFIEHNPTLLGGNLLDIVSLGRGLFRNETYIHLWTNGTRKRPQSFQINLVSCHQYVICAPQTTSVQNNQHEKPSSFNGILPILHIKLKLYFNHDISLLNKLYMTQMSPRHDDVIKWKHFPRYWPLVRGIHRWPVNSPHKGQWRRALMFSLICALNKRLSKQSWGWWVGTPTRSLWRHCNACGLWYWLFNRKGEFKWYYQDVLCNEIPYI